MKLLIDRRGRGKTTALIEWMRQAPDGELRVYVAHDHLAAMAAYRSTMTENEDGLPVSDLESWQFISWDELADYGPAILAYRRPLNIVLAVDNLDLILRRIITSPVAIATWNAEEIVEYLSGCITVETAS